MGKDSDKKMLFEAMHKITGMPLNENIHNNIYDGGIFNSKNTADALSIGHNIYREVKELINAQTSDDVWAGGAENALKFYEKIFEGLRDALYQDLGDSVNPNAGAAPDEMSESNDFENKIKKW